MTKLHILLLTTIIGVGLYMFLIYREIKSFEREVADLRVKFHSLAASQPHSPSINSVDVVGIESVPPPPSTTAEVPVVANNKDDDSIEDDEASVTSNEIKEILTNIQDINDTIDDGECDVQASVCIDREAPSGTPSKSKINPKIAALKLAELTDEEIQDISYDNLRAILRNHGVANPRGTKPELVQKAIEVKNSRKVLDV